MMVRQCLEYLVSGLTMQVSECEIFGKCAHAIYFINVYIFSIYEVYNKKLYCVCVPICR